MGQIMKIFWIKIELEFETFISKFIQSAPKFKQVFYKNRLW